MTIRRPAGFVTRRHRPSAAAVAYSHALLLTENVEKSAQIAMTALRRGGGSRLSVAAHARHLAQMHARKYSANDLKIESAANLRDFALQLARSRPAVERAIVDLECRYSLTPSALSRVLGTSVERTRTLSRMTSKMWAENLDPAVMAWLGPGSCIELASVLNSVKPSNQIVSLTSTQSNGDPSNSSIALMERPEGSEFTVEQLLDLSDSVWNHTQSCDMCADRLRTIPTVKQLLSRTPIHEVPPSVARAARTAYRRIPTPLPPSIDARRFDISRLRQPVLAAGGVITAIAIGIAMLQNGTDSKPSQAERVRALVDAPAPSSLLATPSILDEKTETASISNNGDAVLTWTAHTNVSWIRISPSSGVISPAQTVSVEISRTKSASGSDLANTAINFSSSDGSRQTIRLGQ